MQAAGGSSVAKTMEYEWQWEPGLLGSVEATTARLFLSLFSPVGVNSS